MNLKPLFIAAALAVCTSAIAAPVTLTVTSQGTTTYAGGVSIPDAAPYLMTTTISFDTATIYDYSIIDFRAKLVVDNDYSTFGYVGSAMGPMTAYFSQHGNTTSFNLSSTAMQDEMRYLTNFGVTWNTDQPLPNLNKSFELTITDPISAYADVTQMFSGEFDWYLKLAPETVYISVVSVPEPQTWAMMLAGLGLAGGAARRRQKAA